MMLAGEYETMFRAETEMWWYRSLHRRVLRAIEQHFDRRDIAILDAGCGTGGCLDFLRKNGYEGLEGFDFNEQAVELARLRQLQVRQANLLTVADLYEPEQFDVIFCNDLLYFLMKSKLKTFLTCFTDCYVRTIW